MSINSPYRIGTYPSGAKTEGKFYMTSNQAERWGSFHNGYDLVGHPFISCTCGKPDHECKCNATKTDEKYNYPQKMLYSTTPGEVVYAGWENSRNHQQGFGLYVCIKSSIPGETKYYHYFGHMCEISDKIKVGTKVETGTFLGIEGSTGYSFGSHVHYEIRVNRKKPSGPSSSNFISLEKYTGISNIKEKYYVDSRIAFQTENNPEGEPTYYSSVRIGTNMYTPYIFTNGEWMLVSPNVYDELTSSWRTAQMSAPLSTDNSFENPYVDIPQDGNIGTVISYMGYHLITAKSSNQYKLKQHSMNSGRYKYSNPEYYATIDGRMLIATKPNIGNKLSVSIGDYVDVSFKASSGDVFIKKCIIGDFKGSDAPNPWGHYDGQGVVEMIYHNYSPPSGYTANKNNPWGSGRVTRITKVGSYGNYK